MSFFGKFKAGSTQAQANSTPAKKDPNAPIPTALEKHLANATGPVRPDGSDKFFGFENYGSTCYCNSIIQCLYYSAPFRENVINFPTTAFLDRIRKTEPNGAPLSPRTTVSTTPYPNPASPARKPNAPIVPGSPGQPKAEESKDSPEYRKKTALQVGPVLDMTHDNSLQYGMDESLFTSLRDIFEAIIGQQSRIGVVSPHRFLEILKRENEMFRSAMHQDAHEFLNLLLNQVVDNVEMFSKQHPALTLPQANGGAPEISNGTDMTVSTNGITMPKIGLDTRWVHDLFEGLLTSETRCLTCENTSQRDEAFLDLSVDLSPHTSVTSCLRKFSEEEMLCERNKFHCDNCGGLQEAEKRMKIKRLPRILALHLKRFKYTEDLQRLQKLFHRVQYPFHLRLFNTTDDAEDPDRLYELYAVVVHIGGGPYHGHYVSIIKTQDRGWLLFDDELVEPVDKSYVMNFFGGEPPQAPGQSNGPVDPKYLACAYVLFYQETTLEAVLKEQEAETRGAPTPVRTSDDTAKDTISPMKNGNGLQHIYTTQIPKPQELDHMDPLVHASTEPNIAQHMPHSFEAIPQVPMVPLVPAKSKKELKVEEKEKKAAQKAAEKAAEEKRKEQSQKRLDAWKKADEEMKAVLEMSKASAVEEAKGRGEPEKKEKEGGLARFRHGSMSLRKKPSIFGGKDKEASKLPTVPQGNGTTIKAAGKEVEEDETSTSTPPPAAAAAAAAAAAVVPSQAPSVQPAQTEEKTRKHRFSLGRKKSTLIG